MLAIAYIGAAIVVILTVALLASEERDFRRDHPEWRDDN